MQAFPRLRLMIPEVVLIENEQGCFLQVNSLGPVYKGRVERFLRHANDAPMRERRSIRYSVVPDSYEAWEEEMRSTLSLIKAGARRSSCLRGARRSWQLLRSHQRMCC